MDKASGQIPEAGEKGSAEAEKTAGKTSGMGTTRAERKATTKAANKSGQIPEAGETGSEQVKKP